MLTPVPPGSPFQVFHVHSGGSEFQGRQNGAGMGEGGRDVNQFKRKPSPAGLKVAPRKSIPVSASRRLFGARRSQQGQDPFRIKVDHH